MPREQARSYRSVASTPWRSRYDPHEVCGYPDNGKVMVRALKTVGRLERRDYMEGEPDPPRIFTLHSP